jgi:hypothetical protein
VRSFAHYWVIERTQGRGARDLFRSFFWFFPNHLPPAPKLFCTSPLTHLHSKPFPHTLNHCRPSHIGHYTRRKSPPLSHRAPLLLKNPRFHIRPPNLHQPNLHINCTIFFFFWLFLTAALCCTKCSCPLWLVFSYFAGGWNTFKVVSQHWV